MSRPPPALSPSATIESEHFALPYRWRAAAASGTRRPLVLLLHGVGGDESSLLPLAERLTPEVHLALVRAPHAVPEGGHAWYGMSDLGHGLRPDPDQAEASRQMLLQLIDQLRMAHAFDPRQVYVAGFSQGAVMSASVGLTRPDKVAGIALLAGRILPQVKWQLAPTEQLARLQAFLAHGSYDNAITPDHAADAMHTMAEHRVQLVYRDYPVGHEISAAMAADFAQWVAQRAHLAYTAPDEI
ncbi:alpha/beta hydrolase [Caldimonas tepidiphila]|uniref:alpha/beta hydrolase n=1 Tax=Caldimonas tepidiphila TaxID=2315841 RepID=UPI000E5B9650|nr:PHB depolymerase family esterase [Caldimonas tepidiphila]